MVLVYLSAPIIKKTSRKEDFCTRVVSLLEDLGLTVFAPQFLTPADSETVYRRDVHKLRMCDFLIAEVSNSSLGVGMRSCLQLNT